MPHTAIGRLRAVGMLEALSFLVLLGIAMPLKYWADMPQAVRVVGWVHGVLFMAFCLAAVVARRAHGWPTSRIAVVIGAALLPCGPFFIDGSLKREDQQ